MKSDLDRLAFVDRALADGYDEVVDRPWAAGLKLDTHQHPFALRVHVARGSVTLTVGGQSRDYGEGEGFELDAGVPHAEFYGPDGALFWVARRHPAA